MRETLGVLLFLASWMLPFASGQTLIPAAPGNQWVLNSVYTPAPITFSVQRTSTLGPRTVTELNQVYPWGEYSLLLSQDSAGVSLEGYSYAGSTYWLPSPAVLFNMSATVGETWETPLGPVRLVSKTASIATSSQTFTGVVLFSVGSSSQVWGFKPGFGIVSFAVNGVDFTVTNSVSQPHTPQAQSALPKACPIPGLTSIPEDGSLSFAQREKALTLATNAGSKTLIVGATWAELEPSPGTYNLGRIQHELQLAKKYNLTTVLNLRLPQTLATAMPSYLSGKQMDDSLVLARLDLLLSRIAAILTPQVKWVNVGYEVDTYTSMHPESLNAYIRMFGQARNKLKILIPNISVGQVFSFDTSRTSNQMFRAISTHADHISFTYYGLTGTFQQRTATAPAFDIPLMISMANGKPVIIAELGYSSGVSNQTEQAQFFSTAIDALRQAGGSVVAFSVWSYRDIPAANVPVLASQFGQAGPEFAQFITSLGLIDQYDVPKPAWFTFVSEVPTLSQTGACIGL